MILALLVLTSTVSFTVDKHFCGTHLVDLAIFSEAEDCGIDDSEGSMSCEGCRDQKVSVEGQNDLKLSFHSLELPQQVFLTTFTFSYVNLFQDFPQEITLYKDYSPPLLVRDFQVLHETFLI